MPSQVILLNIIFFSFSGVLYGQVPQGDTVFFQASKNQGIDVSAGLIDSHSPLYNGSEYVNYDNQIAGYQFFESPVLEDGSIMYNGLLYENVRMLYDIRKDEVIIEHFDKYFKIRLVSEKISYFTLLNHTFSRFEADTAAGSVFPAGFYETLYEGQIKVLAKRAKIYKETLENQRVIREFLPDDRYYIFKNKAYYQVKSKRGAIQVLKNRKKEVRQFIAQNNINFKVNFEQALISLSRFYDKLPNE